MAAKPPALIIADDLEILPAIREACESTQTPLFVSPKPCSAVIELLRIYLSRRLAGSTSVHGVLMDVFGMGVLITGDSGVGKSELALELISRGHGLVADDVVELACIAPTTIEGRCPSMLRDYLEVRGLGLLNIRTIFGETASRRKMKLKLIAHSAKADQWFGWSASASRRAKPGNSWRAHTQGGHSRRCREKHCRSPRGGGAQQHSSASRHRQHGRFHQPPAAGAS
jgi:serine kinase of HPr protein (carbohydrate metabolism regulator)